MNRRSGSFLPVMVQLGSGKKSYPDFTLLNTKTREEVYFEQFGLLDDEDYRGEALRKPGEYKVVDKTAYVNYTRTDTFLNKR